MTLNARAVQQAVVEQTGVDWPDASAVSAAAQINRHLALADQILTDVNSEVPTVTDFASTLADLCDSR